MGRGRAWWAPRREVEHLPGKGCICRACGGTLRKVGEDVTGILMEDRPGRLKAVRYVRPASSVLGLPRGLLVGWVSKAAALAEPMAAFIGREAPRARRCRSFRLAGAGGAPRFPPGPPAPG